jgi:hypothetical protein
MPRRRQLPSRNERNFDTHPYTPDELRVVAWIQKRAPDVGGGDDPIGFLLSSYELLHMDHAALRQKLASK